MDSDEITAVKAFVAAINDHDISRLADLMTEDHTFVDSRGNTESGRDKMAEGWKGYYSMFPDYRIDVEDIFACGNLVAAFGSAFGTYNGKRGLVPANQIEMPAAWRAIVEDGKVKRWQVYADWSEGGKIIEEEPEKGQRLNWSAEHL